MCYQINRVAFLILVSVTVTGCAPPQSQTVTNEDGSVSTVKMYSDDEVIDAEDQRGEKYCKLVLPFARAMENRDYDAAYDAIDQMAFQDVHALQFVRESPRKEIGNDFSYNYLGDADDRIGDVDKDTFKKLMQQEDVLGKPFRLSDIVLEDDFKAYGETMVPRAGRYPSGFPFEKVVASVTISLDCEINDDVRDAWAQRYECDPEDISGECWLTIFALIVEVDGDLKVAHIDFLEMSLEE